MVNERESLSSSVQSSRRGAGWLERPKAEPDRRSSPRQDPGHLHGCSSEDDTGPSSEKETGPGTAPSRETRSAPDSNKEPPPGAGNRTASKERRLARLHHQPDQPSSILSGRSHLLSATDSTCATCHPSGLASPSSCPSSRLGRGSSNDAYVSPHAGLGSSTEIGRGCSPVLCPGSASAAICGDAPACPARFLSASSGVPGAQVPCSMRSRRSSRCSGPRWPRSGSWTRMQKQ